MRALCCVLAACGGVRVPTASDPFDAIVTATLAEEPTPGVAVVVTRGRQLVFAHAYGEANRETHLPMAVDTPVRIGSLTKPFTAVAVMQLVDAGKIALDDPITKYLDLPARGHRITIRDLLAQRSGLPNYVAMIANLDGNFDRTPAEIFALVRDVEPEFPPGTKDQYSNTNYYVLGLVVERVTGEPFGDYLRAHVTGAAGDATKLCATAPSRGYDRGSAGDFTPEPDVGISAAFSSGGMCSTAVELSRWFAALYRGDVVPRATMATMTTVPPLPDGSHADDAFGVAVYDVGGHREINKSGAIAGFLASSTYIPDADLLVVVVGNACCDGVTLVDARLTRALLQLPPDVLVSAADAAWFAGRWIRTTATDQPALPMRASVRGSHLRFERDDGFTLHYRHLGGRVFENEYSPGTTLRVTGDGFEVIERSGRHLAYRRM